MTPKSKYRRAQTGDHETMRKPLYQRNCDAKSNGDRNETAKRPPSAILRVVRSFTRTKLAALAGMLCPSGANEGCYNISVEHPTPW